MNDFIDLPPLPECLLNLPLETLHDIQSHTYHAIKADRQGRGEPVAYFQNSNSTNGKPPQYEQVCASAKNDPDVFPLYAASQPAAPAQEPSDEDIERLAAEHLSAHAQFVGAGEVHYWGEIEFARALLARYGQLTTPAGSQSAWKGPTDDMVTVIEWVDGVGFQIMSKYAPKFGEEE